MLGLSIQIQYELGMSTTIEQLIAQSLNKDPAAAAAFTKLTGKRIKQVQQAALRVTAARMRRVILNVYATNEYQWKQHQQYTNWLGGLAGPVQVAHLVRANRPIKALTAKGNKRKRGYSQRPINMPKPYALGGRLPNSTRYKVSESNMQVGVLPTARAKIKDKMSAFQDGGKIQSYDPESSRRYLAALGLFYRRSTILRAQPRPLYDKVVEDYPPQELFSKAFLDMLNDKLRVGD